MLATNKPGAVAVGEGAAAAVQVADAVAVVGVMFDSDVGAVVEAIVGTRVGNRVKVTLGVCVGVGGNVAVAGTGVGNEGCVGTSVVVGNRTGVTLVVDEEHAIMAIARIASIANVRGNILGITLLLAEKTP